MKNERPDGQSVRDLLESALAQSLGVRSAPVAAAPSACATPGASLPSTPASSAGAAAGSPAAGSPAAGSPVVVGEIIDTHHPHLPGRVLVRWWASAEAEREGWLHHERHLSLVRGDRVLVTLPLGWAEWLVTGAIGRGSSLGASRASAPESAAPAATPPDNGESRDGAREPLGSAQREGATRLQLGPGQALVIVGHDGQALLQVSQAPEGLRLELMRDQVEIKARRRLRLSADSIEIAAGPGGVDVRTEGDAVTRARAIRLN